MSPAIGAAQGRGLYATVVRFLVLRAVRREFPEGVKPVGPSRLGDGADHAQGSLAEAPQPGYRREPGRRRFGLMAHVLW